MQIYVTGFEIWNNSDFNAAENMCNLHTVHHTLHHIWQSWHKICIENQATPLKKNLTAVFAAGSVAVFKTSSC